MRIKIQYLMFSIITMYCLLLMAGCQKQAAVQKEEPEVVPVKVNAVELRDIQQTLDYVGNVKAQEEALVYPKVSGKIIEKVKEDSSKVEKGDIIFYIDRDEVGLKFEKAPVESPIDGVIGRILVDIGENVSVQTAVALVIDMRNVKIGLNVPEKYLPQVLIDQVADISVDAYGNEKFEGRVTKISPVLDLDTRSAPLEITVSNKDQRLKSGMFAKISLIIKEHKAVPVVLKEAIIGREPNTYVYVIQDNKAFLRKVSLGIRKNEYFHVKDGLKIGDQVVIMGQQKLKDGISVKVE